MSVALRSYQSVAHDRIFEEFDKGIRSTLLVLPTGCVAGDTVIGVNRCGKGYSRTIADAYRLQSHPRVNHEYLTRVRSHVGDRIGLHPIKGIVYSGMKTVCDLRLEDGKSIRTTPDHEIMAESGWVALGDLAEGDRVACESDPPVDRPRKPKLQYVVVQGLVNHPYAMGVTSRTRTGRKPEGRLYRVARHRLVAEAEANGMTFEEMVSICRSDPVRASSLTFFDPSDYAVHHDDRNHRNNVGPNLKVLTHEDHARLHGKTDTLANFGCGLIGYSRVISVKTIGVQATYDIVCEDPHRNFVGNGIVVHNCGKTITFGAVARDVIHSGQGRVLVLAHRGELLDQAADSLAALDVETAIEKAERSARGSLFGDPDCVVASVQTMQRARLQSWPRKHFKLVVTDESHHAISDSYQNIYKHLDPDWHLGVTATADRLDGENLGQVYQSVAFEYSLRQAIEEGWLARLKVVRCDTEVDLSAIRTTGGDMNAVDLEDAIRPHVEELANATRQEIGDRRAIVFTPDVGSADAFASALTSLGIRSESIAGDSRDRAEIIDGFRKGRSRVLCNCLDEQTEILTNRGWVGIDDFQESDLTAAPHPQLGRIRWEPVSRIVIRPREPGERMVAIGNQTLDIRVTEGHRMLARTRGAVGWKFSLAAELPGRVAPYQLPMAGYDDPHEPFVPEEMEQPSGLTVDQCRFIGLWIADGYLDSRGGRGITISQSGVYPEANREIRRILDSCGFDWKVSVSRNAKSEHLQYRYRVPKGNIGGELSRSGFASLLPYLDKDFSPILFGLDREQCRALIEGLWLGDGVKFKKRPPRNGVRSGWTIVNTNKAMLDKLQWLAVTRGFASNVSRPKDNGSLSTKPIYQICIRDRDLITTNNSHVPTSGGNPATFEADWKPERVWCVTNTTGTIITRRNGKVAVMGQCNLLTEGFDAPFVSAIVLARPTKSRSLFSQMVGRGTRRAHGKDDCLIVDFDWKQLTGKHALISPVELFDTTKMDAEVQDLARRMVESGESPDLMDAIERAEATHAERVKIRVKARERESRYRRVAYDPFAVMDTLGIASRAEAESSLRVKPTDRQIATLEKLGVTDARSMSRRRASQMLDVLFSRMDRKLATLKQISHLISNGIDPDEARAMTKDEASARLDVLFGKAVAR